MKELYTTGVPVPFECQFACRVKKTDCAKIEKALHTAFAPERVNANREFFRIKVEQAKAILELFHHEDFTNEFIDEIQDDLTQDDKDAVKKAKPRRPPLNFYEMGLHDGDILVFEEDPSITAEIIGPKKVRCGDENEISLTAILLIVLDLFCRSFFFFFSCVLIFFDDYFLYCVWVALSFLCVYLLWICGFISIGLWLS